MLHTNRQQTRGDASAAPQALVLVASSKLPIARLIAVNLQRAGAEVVVVSDGAAILAEARTRCPDGIVLDAAMPELSGGDVFGRLQTDLQTRHIPVLMLGSEATEQPPTGQARLFGAREFARFIEAVQASARRRKS